MGNPKIKESQLKTIEKDMRSVGDITGELRFLEDWLENPKIGVEESISATSSRSLKEDEVKMQQQSMRSINRKFQKENNIDLQSTYQPEDKMDINIK